jgi:hypothetical protein
LAQSQSSGGTTVTWNDPNDLSAGWTVTSGSKVTSDSEAASAGMDVAGAGAAGVEAQFGEQFLGTPNGGLYSRPWANGVGRSVSISTLTKVGGGYLFLAGTFMDLQSLQDGDITEGQFYTTFFSVQTTHWS